VSAWRAAYEALSKLLNSAKGAEWAAELRGLAARVSPGKGEPDPLLLKAFTFLAERAPALREEERPWGEPAFRLFSEAFMLSREFMSLLRRGLTSIKPPSYGAVVDLHSGPGVCLEVAAELWSRLIAVDPFDENLELVEERMRGVGVSGYKLVKGDYVGLARLVREPVSVVIVASPSNWFYELREVAGRVYSVLEPGGFMLLLAPLEWGEPSPVTPFIRALGGASRLDAGYIEDWLRMEGFTRIKVRRGDLLTLMTAVKP